MSPLSLGELRKRRGLTQVQLSERSGLSQENISRIERGANPTLETVRRYVKSLGGEIQIVAAFDKDDRFELYRGE